MDIRWWMYLILHTEQWSSAQALPTEVDKRNCHYSLGDKIYLLGGGEQTMEINQTKF